MVSLELLPMELVLDLAEHMDIASLKQFMATNKDLYELINSHERSITEAKTSAYTLPPCGKYIMSSTTITRHVLSCGTFKAAAELERRERRVDDLLRHSTEFLDMTSPLELRSELTTAQQDRLVGLLWRAIYHCDRVADLAANGPHEAAGAPPPERWDLITTGAWRLPEEDFPEEIRGRDPCTNFAARPAQIAYIRALPAQDVLFIFYLVAVCGAAFSRKRRIYESSDPAALERVTIFEECVLRHGTYFLWSYVRSARGGEMEEMSGHLLAAGLDELADWETGKPGVMAGLRMTLLNRFREVCLDGDDDDETGISITRCMFEMVGDLILGRKGGKKGKGGKKEGEEGKEDDEDEESRDEGEGEGEGDDVDVDEA